MILSMLKIKPLPEKKQEVVDILKSLQKELRMIHDCLDAEIYQTVEPDSNIFFLEQWRKKEALYRYIESELYMRALTVMELSAESPEVIFPEVTDESGMDLISELREGSKRDKF